MNDLLWRVSSFIQGNQLFHSSIKNIFWNFRHLHFSAENIKPTYNYPVDGICKHFLPCLYTPWFLQNGLAIVNSSYWRIKQHWLVRFYLHILPFTTFKIGPPAYGLKSIFQKADSQGSSPEFALNSAFLVLISIAAIIKDYFWCAKETKKKLTLICVNCQPSYGLKSYRIALSLRYWIDANTLIVPAGNDAPWVPLQ